MKIFIGADHRGFKLKQEVLAFLRSFQHDITDCGNRKFDPDDDFTDFSFAVAQKVAGNPGSRGIVICGSGGGVTIAANKVKGILCAQAINKDEVIHNRKHDDINILAIGSDFISPDEVKGMIQVFLNTEFLNEDRLNRRLGEIKKQEELAFK